MTSQFFLNHSSIQAKSMPPAQPASWMSRNMRASCSPCSRSDCPPWVIPCGCQWATSRELGTPNSEISTGCFRWWATRSRR